MYFLQFLKCLCLPLLPLSTHPSRSDSPLQPRIELKVRRSCWWSLVVFPDFKEIMIKTLAGGLCWELMSKVFNIVQRADCNTLLQ